MMFLHKVVLHCTVSVGLAAAALCLLSALGLAASAQRDPDPAWEGPVGRGGYSTDDVWKSRRWRLRRPRWEARAGHGARQGRPGGDGSQAHSALRLAGRVQPRPSRGPPSLSALGWAALGPFCSRPPRSFPRIPVPLHQSPRPAPSLPSRIFLSLAFSSLAPRLLSPISPFPPARTPASSCRPWPHAWAFAVVGVRLVPFSPSPSPRSTDRQEPASLGLRLRLRELRVAGTWHWSRSWSRCAWADLDPIMIALCFSPPSPSVSFSRHQSPSPSRARRSQHPSWGYTRRNPK
ncbi:unnamed protein product [Prorocentrum cordatum]|uniref:Uncharacterized protein n=1 Tax=Prorocentrum cordatum TaxID=2364126 RepID=A0ABN9PKQ4_9DINO|nr:unnamed protein product [Polarella glacialis]